MNTMQKDMGLVVLSIVLAVFAFMGMQRVDKYIKVKALNDCAQAYRYEAKIADGATVTYPLGDEYKNCLKEKGY